MEILAQISGTPWKRLAWGECDSPLRWAESYVPLSSTWSLTRSGASSSASRLRA